MITLRQLIVILSLSFLHYICLFYITSAFSTLPLPFLHYICLFYITSAFSTLPLPFLHYIYTYFFYITSAFSTLHLPFLHYLCFFYITTISANDHITSAFDNITFSMRRITCLGQYDPQRQGDVRSSVWVKVTQVIVRPSQDDEGEDCVERETAAHPAHLLWRQPPSGRPHEGTVG